MYHRVYFTWGVDCDDACRHFVIPFHVSENIRAVYSVKVRHSSPQLTILNVIYKC